MNQAPGSICS
jgi:hypothetical protein